SSLVAQFAASTTRAAPAAAAVRYFELLRTAFMTAPVRVAPLRALSLSSRLVYKRDASLPAGRTPVTNVTASRQKNSDRAGADTRVAEPFRAATMLGMLPQPKLGATAQICGSVFRSGKREMFPITTIDRRCVDFGRTKPKSQTFSTVQLRQG